MATNFYLEKRPDKKGDCAIRVSISILGVRLITSTGYSINPAKWDKENQKVKKGCNNSKGITYNVINLQLNTIDGDVIRYENKCRENRIVPTVALIKENINIRPEKAVKAKANKPKATTQITEVVNPFFTIFDAFVKENGQGNNWTLATYEKFRAVKNSLTQFDSEITFDALDEHGLSDYVNFLRTTRKMRNSTILKQLGFLKWFLRWSVAKKHTTETAFQTFKPKLKSSEKKVIFLTWDELMRVYEFDFGKKEYLARVRDVFCFCCFTSLRYSDVANLRRSDVKSDSIEITTIKTADSLTIQLNKYSRALLDKYKDIPFEGNRAFPIITNQRMNDYIKELGQICGIDEPITITYYNGNQRIDEVYPKYELLGTHAGRRTFICNALSLGIPAQVVMKWTGHSDYKAMKPYVDIADKIKVEAMSKFDKL